MMCNKPNAVMLAPPDKHIPRQRLGLVIFIDKIQQHNPQQGKTPLGITSNVLAATIGGISLTIYLPSP